MDRKSYINEVKGQYNDGLITLGESLTKLVYEGVPASVAVFSLTDTLCSSELRALRYINAHRHLDKTCGGQEHWESAYAQAFPLTRRDPEAMVGVVFASAPNLGTYIRMELEDHAWRGHCDEDESHEVAYYTWVKFKAISYGQSPVTSERLASAVLTHDYRNGEPAYEERRELLFRR